MAKSRFGQSFEVATLLSLFVCGIVRSCDKLGTGKTEDANKTQNLHVRLSIAMIRSDFDGSEYLPFKNKRFHHRVERSGNQIFLNEALLLEGNIPNPVQSTVEQNYVYCLYRGFVSSPHWMEVDAEQTCLEPYSDTRLRDGLRILPQREDARLTNWYKRILRFS
jgi:hypothetical protein